MAKLVFDCFTFFNELDLLELRLHELSEKVDYFVLAESPITFKGQPKELFYENNKPRFKAFEHKIIHLVIDDMPESKNAWNREHFQRNALRRGFADIAAPDDIIIISDADEILRSETIDTLRATSGFTQLAMPMYQYYMNLREQHGWTKVFAFSHELLDRLPDFNWVRTSQEEAFRRFAGINQKSQNSGWHFTYLGGAAKIREKLNAFSHDETWFQLMLAPGGIETQILAGFEVGNALNFNRFCEVDETYPAYVRANLPKYHALGYVKDLSEALSEMQMLLRSLHESARRDRQKVNFLEREYGAKLARLGLSIEYTKP